MVVFMLINNHVTAPNQSAANPNTNRNQPSEKEYAVHQHRSPLTAVAIEPVTLEKLLDDMFPPLGLVGDLLAYNLLAFPVVSRGMMVDLHRTESPEVRVVAAPIEAYKLEMEADIIRAVRGVFKKPKKKEFNFALEITPETFVSRKQFRVNVTVWAGRKKHPYLIENDERRMQSMFDRFHKKIMQDWLRQFEILTQSLELDESMLYQMLFQFFEPEDTEIA